MRREMGSGADASAKSEPDGCLAWTFCLDVFGEIVADSTCRIGEHGGLEVALEARIHPKSRIVEEIQRLRGADVGPGRSPLADPSR